MWHLGLHSKLAHTTHLHFSLVHRESLPLYLTNTIKSFAISMVGLYVPIFIFATFKNNQLITTDTVLNGIYLVLIFYALRSFATLMFMHKTINFIFGWINFKWSIFIANIMLAAAMYLLTLSEKNVIFLFIAAAVFSIETLMYWIPFHTNFVRVFRYGNNGSRIAKFGSSTGMRLFLASIVSAIGPALGGLIIKLYGFDTLFFISIAILIMSSLPVIIGNHETKHGKHNLFKIINKYLFQKKYQLNTLAHMASGIDGNLYAIFAPLLLYIVADGNTSSVGLVISIAVFLASIFTLIAGKIIDKTGDKKIHKISLFFNSLLYIPRIFVATPGVLYIVDIFDKINGSFLSVPLLSATYNQAELEENETDYMIYREFFIHLGVVVGSLLFALMIILFNNWRMVFAILALISPLTYFIHFTSKLKN